MWYLSVRGHLMQNKLIACAEQKVGDEQCLGAGEGSVPSTAALQKEEALGLSAEEQDEKPNSIWGTGGASSALPLWTHP